MNDFTSVLIIIGVLVFVHELGHFLVARWHGVRCLTFALGFGPKLLQTKRGDTVYCICAVPLGGYVRMAGMGEGADDKPEGKSDEFPSKTKWQRFQILLAGPAMNGILAVVVMTVVLYQGAEVPVYPEQPPVVGSVAEDSPAAAAGIRPGDRILRVAGREIDTWEELMFSVVSRADRETEVVLRRDGGAHTFQVTPAAQGRYDMGDLGVGPVTTPQVTSIASTTSSVAQDAGIQVGDLIEAIDGREVTLASLIEEINASAGTPRTLLVRRDGARRDIVVTPLLVGDVGLIGVGLSPYEVRVVEPEPFEALTLSLEQNVEWSGAIFQTLWGLATGEVSVKQLSGPVGIAQLSGDAAELGWTAFFGLMAFISINLGILNLMPIPVLDGGHILILAMEGVSRRDFSLQLKERLMFVGLALIIPVMVMVIYNDLTRTWVERFMIWR